MHIDAKVDDSLIGGSYQEPFSRPNTPLLKNQTLEASLKVQRGKGGAKIRKEEYIMEGSIGKYFIKIKTRDYGAIMNPILRSPDEGKGMFYGTIDGKKLDDEAARQLWNRFLNIAYKQTDYYDRKNPR